ncbi:MAG: hypothetical protein BWK73_36500, partial [Thiothrix lacustris]
NTTATPDSFTFKVNDGTQDSVPATVKLVVTGVNDVPTAQNGTAATVQDTAVDIVLLGSDVDGDPLTYVPSKSKQGGTVVVKSGKTVTYTPKKGYLGADSFTFTVKDNKRGTSRAATVSVTVRAKPQNILPTPNAGADRTVNEKTLVTLDGSGSKDSDGTIASYAWKQTAGATVTLAGATTAKPTFTAPDIAADTTLTFELTVTDNKGATAKDTVNIAVKNVANLPPTANAGADRTINEKTLVTLDGSVSKDSDGTIASYAWKQTAGATVTLAGATTAKPTFTTPDVATNTTLTFELTVTDNKGATAKDTVSILVKAVIEVMVQPTPTGKINDTGITLCGDYAFGGSDNHNNNVNCGLQTDIDGDQIPPGQDATFGRDVTHNDDSDGHAGFSYTKIDSSGRALPATATEWSCVKDNVTGLIWEIKTKDRGLHHKDWSYSWYDPDSTKNAGNAGFQDGGDCSGSRCDTSGYVAAVNAVGWCGAKDWRMPDIKELISLLAWDNNYPALNTDYFPDNESDGSYRRHWSETPSASDLYVDGFRLKRYMGFIYSGDMGEAVVDARFKVRLVRGKY